METEVLTETKLSHKEYSALNAQAANYRVILRFLKAAGFDQFLQDKKLPPIDLLQTPDDMTGGESANLFLKEIADQCNKMDQKIKSLSEALLDNSIALAKEKRKNPRVVKKGNFLSRIFHAVQSFIFVSNNER